MIGLSTAMANGTDVAEWFGSKKYFYYNFKPSVRPVPITIHFDGFSEKNYCPRMATMNKPAFIAIKKFSDGKPVLVIILNYSNTNKLFTDFCLLKKINQNNRSRLNCYNNELRRVWKLKSICTLWIRLPRFYNRSSWR